MPKLIRLRQKICWFIFGKPFNILFKESIKKYGSFGDGFKEGMAEAETNIQKDKSNA